MRSGRLLPSTTPLSRSVGGAARRRRGRRGHGVRAVSCWGRRTGATRARSRPGGIRAVACDLHLDGGAEGVQTHDARTRPVRVELSQSHPKRRHASPYPQVRCTCALLCRAPRNGDIRCGTHRLPARRPRLLAWHRSRSSCSVSRSRPGVSLVTAEGLPGRRQRVRQRRREQQPGRGLRRRLAGQVAGHLLRRPRQEPRHGPGRHQRARPEAAAGRPHRPDHGHPAARHGADQDQRAGLHPARGPAARRRLGRGARAAGRAGREPAAARPPRPCASCRSSRPRCRRRPSRPTPSGTSRSASCSGSCWASATPCCAASSTAASATPETIERDFGVTVAGAIPETPALVRKKGGLVPLVVTGPRKAKDPVHSAESFLKLRTNLQFMDIDNPPRVIVVTSPLPGDGKSTVADEPRRGAVHVGPAGRAHRRRPAPAGAGGQLRADRGPRPDRRAHRQRAVRGGRPAGGRPAEPARARRRAGAAEPERDARLEGDAPAAGAARARTTPSSSTRRRCCR